MNFTAFSGLGLPLELIGISGQPICKMKNRKNIAVFADFLFQFKDN